MQNKDAQYFLQKLKQYKLEERLTLKKIAGLIGGVSYATIGRWLRGRSVPSDNNLYHLKIFITRRLND